MKVNQPVHNRTFSAVNVHNRTFPAAMKARTPANVHAAGSMGTFDDHTSSEMQIVAASATDWNCPACYGIVPLIMTKGDCRNMTENFYDRETNSIEWIDPETWERKDLFAAYLGTDLPYIIITANVDVTKPLRYAKKKGLSFNLVMVYLCVKAMDQIPNYRYRFIDGKPFVIDHTRPVINHIIPGQELFVMAEGKWPCEDIEEFCRETHKRLETAGPDSREIMRQGKLDLVNFTALPWVQYTGFIRTIRTDGVDNAPKMSFGKYFEDPAVPGRVWMPVSSQTHHGLMDGWHVGRFYEMLQKACDEIEE